MDTISFPLGLIVNLLILIVLVSVVAQRLHVPYTVALVFAGLLAPLLSPLSLPQFTPESFLSVLLPPVIFQTATGIKLSNLLDDADIIFSYTFMGTLLSALLIGVFTYLILGFGFLESLLLGIIISPTDPIAVISTLKRLGAPERLRLIIEGESLFNDGVAVVLYSAIVGAIVSSSFDVLSVVEGIFIAIFVGVAIGGSIGYLLYVVFPFLRDRFIQIILTFITMYGSYQVASYLHGSGIISVGVAGVIIGNYVPRVIPQRSVEDLDLIWEFLAFIITSLSFILIGLDVQISLLGTYMSTIIMSIFIILAARAIAIYGLSGVLNLRRHVITRSWQTIIIWSGLRGAVSIMLALGLRTLPIRNAMEISAIAFGMVFFSVIFQGLSVRFLIQRLAPPKG